MLSYLIKIPFKQTFDEHGLISQFSPSNGNEHPHLNCSPSLIHIPPKTKNSIKNCDKSQMADRLSILSCCVSLARLCP